MKVLDTGRWSKKCGIEKSRRSNALSDEKDLFQ
jgi:hypothetical protein